MANDFRRLKIGQQNRINFILINGFSPVYSQVLKISDIQNFFGTLQNQFFKKYWYLRRFQNKHFVRPGYYVYIWHYSEAIKRQSLTETENILKVYISYWANSQTTDAMVAMKGAMDLHNFSWNQCIAMVLEL